MRDLNYKGESSESTVANTNRDLISIVLLVMYIKNEEIPCRTVIANQDRENEVIIGEL